jgi:UDP-N-acetylglucosamine diphosphorylase/glucosamine-1-phosphate N-acetyltransferase
MDGETEIGMQDGTVIYARLKANEVASLADSISDSPEDLISKLISLSIPKREIQGVELVSYLWELIGRNGDAIKADFEFYADPKASEGVIENGAYVRAGDEDDVKSYDAEETMKLMLAGELPLYIGEGARIKPNVLIDLTGGPVYIGAYADVRPPTIIDGPCCMMDSAGTPKKTTIIDGAKIREGVTLGPVCRVGGEVEESIIQGYSNKHHSGFIGHAYLGEWVNIGAMATNSDLKNDYSNVKVPVNGDLVDTGDPKVGSFIGDHAKLGIGALLTTGTVVGIMTNVLNSGAIPPKFVPSFCFYREDRLSRGFRPRTLIAAAETVMSRRNITMTPADVSLLEKAYELVKDERDAEIEQQNRKADASILKIVRQWSKGQGG